MGLKSNSFQLGEFDDPAGKPNRNFGLVASIAVRHLVIVHFCSPQAQLLAKPSSYWPNYLMLLGNMDIHFHLIFMWKWMNWFQPLNTWSTAYSFRRGQNTNTETKSKMFEVMQQRRKAELLYWQVLGFWKHPESWNSTVHRWKTKLASFKNKSKLKLRAFICYLSAM